VLPIVALSGEAPVEVCEKLNGEVREGIIDQLPVMPQMIAAYWQEPAGRFARGEPVRSAKSGATSPVHAVLARSTRNVAEILHASTDGIFGAVCGAAGHRTAPRIPRPRFVDGRSDPKASVNCPTLRANFCLGSVHAIESSALAVLVQRI